MKFHPAKQFILCVDRFDAIGGRVWALRIGRRWTLARRMAVQVPMTTVFRGQHARQPKAYLTGFCSRITLDRATDTVTVQ